MGSGPRIVAPALAGLIAVILIAVLARAPVPPTPAPAEALPTAGESVQGAEGALEFHKPASWKRRTVEDVTVLSPRGGGLELTLSAPGPAGDWAILREQTVAGLKTQLEKATVVTTREQVVDGRPSQTTVMSAKQEGGELRVLVTAVKGHERAYLITLFTPELASPAALAEGQAVIDSLRLLK